MGWALIIAGIVGLVIAGAAKKVQQGPGQADQVQDTQAVVPEPSHLDFRPQTLVEYIGQTDMKAVIEIEIDAANKNSVPFPHTLLTGSAGLGKTSIANIIANEMGGFFYTITGPAITNPRQFTLLAVKAYEHPGCIIFIDEAHKIPKEINELFFPLLEDFTLSCTCEDGRVLPGWVSPFTCILATTNPSLITKPLRERCRLHFHLQLYKDEELYIIIEHAFKALCKRYLPGPISAFSWKESAFKELAQNSCGVPRRAIKLACDCFSYLRHINSTFLDAETVKKVLELHGISPGGLERLDLEILHFLEGMRAPGTGEHLPCGLNRMANAINEGREEIEEAEGWLMRKGYITATSDGRIITEAGLKYLQGLNTTQTGNS